LNGSNDKGHERMSWESKEEQLQSGKHEHRGLGNKAHEGSGPSVDAILRSRVTNCHRNESLRTHLLTLAIEGKRREGIAG